MSRLTNLRSSVYICKYINVTSQITFCDSGKQIDKLNYAGIRCNSTQKPENPIDRTVRILGNDMRTIKSYLINDKDQPPGPDSFPSHCDVVVIGGGIIGSSIAYWLKQRVPKGISVAVVEKDPSVNSNTFIPSQYEQASTVLSCGGLRQQFSLPENIEMSMFAANFFRNIKQHLFVEGHDVPDIQFTPNGYLFLSTEKGAEQLEQNSKLQIKLGAKNELLTPSKLKQKFPWINTDGIALGCHGLENEGWFDPWCLLSSFKRKAISLGAEYTCGEVVGFEFKSMPDIMMEGIEPGSYQGLDKLLVKTKSGEVRTIKFAIAIIAAGPQSGHVARLANVGMGTGLLSVPLPVEPRKRYVYCVHCPEGPGLNTPLTIDPTGTYFRREGLGGNYICGRSPTPENEPSVENLDVDYNFFDENVWPVLASRVPAFEKIKVKSAWGGYYEYNTFDENGIVGPHPYYNNLYIASGFSGHGLQQATAVGRAIMEMILDGDFQTIDLTRMGFDRLILQKPIREQNIV